MILLCQLIHFDALLLGPANFELRITIYLVSKKNDREFLRNVLPGRQLFCDISSTRGRRYGTVSVLQFYGAEHHGVALLDYVEHPVAIDTIFWLDSMSTKRCPRVQ